MTAYVNQGKVRHIRMVIVVLLTAMLGVSQISIAPVSAASRLPKPAIQTTLSIETDGSVSIGDSAKDGEVTTPTVLKTMYMDSTAYTSTPEECDGDPFVTADGSDVADGIVATNVLPFGTQIRLPTVFGDKVFTVHDRMNARYSSRVDVWMSDHKAMLNYGVKRNIPIEVISYGDNKTQWAARSEMLKQQRLAAAQAKQVAIAFNVK